jgi:hypothetical protein
MPTPTEIINCSLLCVKRDVLPPIVNNLEKKIEEQNAVIELLKQQMAILMERMGEV